MSTLDGRRYAYTSSFFSFDSLIIEPGSGINQEQYWWYDNVYGIMQESYVMGNKVQFHFLFKWLMIMHAASAMSAPLLPLNFLFPPHSSAKDSLSKVEIHFL